MEGLARASTLMGYRQLVVELGGDPDALLRRFHIPPHAVDQGDGMLPYRSIIRVLEATAATLQQPDFGMRLAQRQGLEVIGPLALIGINTATIGAALAAIFDNIDFYSSALRTEIDRRTDPALPRITLDVNIDNEPHKRQYVERLMCLIDRDLKTLSKGAVAARHVLFRHSTPLPTALYRKYFSSQVSFEQEVNAIVVREEDLACPLDNADPYLRSIVIDYVKQSIQHQPADLRAQVEFLIKRLLPSGVFQLPYIAAHLCMHERTLQRRLKEAGHYFETLVDGVRRERAEELLKNSKLSMAQIAVQLGYVEQTSLNRACMRWFGMSPLRARRQLSAG